MTKLSAHGGPWTRRLLLSFSFGRFFKIQVSFLKGKIFFTICNTSGDILVSEKCPISIRCLHITCYSPEHQKDWIISLPSTALTTYIGKMMVKNGIQST